MERYLLNDEGRYAKQGRALPKNRGGTDIECRYRAKGRKRRGTGTHSPEQAPDPGRGTQASQRQRHSPRLSFQARACSQPGPYGAARRAQAIMPIDTKYPAHQSRVFSVCANRSRNRAADLRALPTTTIGYERESADLQGPLYKRNLRSSVSIRFYPRPAQFISDKRSYTNLYVSSQSRFSVTGS